MARLPPGYGAREAEGNMTTDSNGKLRATLLIAAVHTQDLDARAALVRFLWSLDWLDLTITQDHDALTADRLAQAPCLLVFGSPGEMTNAQMEGLSDWVQGGGALVGIHSATINVNGRPEYHELVGGRFIGHPPFSPMSSRVADPDHFITQGISDFDLEDECYVNEYPDRSSLHVVMTGHHEAENLAEPSSYVKDIGAGRLFITCLGHVGAVFEHAMVQRLISRGIAWAARREDVVGDS